MSIRTKALLAVITGNTIFGFSFLFSKVALQMTVPSVLLAVRFTTAFVVLNLIAFVGRNIKKKDGDPLVEFSLKGKPLKYVLLLALFQPIIYFLGESYGIEYTSSAFAGTYYLLDSHSCFHDKHIEHYAHDRDHRYYSTGKGR